VHIESVKSTFSGDLWTQTNASATSAPERAFAKEHGINLITGLNKPGLGNTHIHYGNNSGYQAINLAYLWGFTRIVLLGYNMAGRGQHFFGKHPKELSQMTDYEGLVPLFGPLADDLRAEGIDVINCTENSALACFRKKSVGDVLRSLSEPA